LIGGKGKGVGIIRPPVLFGHKRGDTMLTGKERERVRKQVKGLMRFIKNPYAWPGGYEVAMITDDGGLICHRCAGEEKLNIISSIKSGTSDGWLPFGYGIDYEGPVHCDHCGRSMANYEEEGAS
jgi:hypothetical protein